MAKKSKGKNKEHSKSGGVEIVSKPEIPGDEKKESAKRVRFQTKDAIILLVIILISLAIRIYGLSFPPKVYFDETHYVPAARDYLSQGRIDRNYIHPPLAKEILAGFIRVFGDKPVVWRLPSVLLGLVMIVFMYLLALKMFRNRFAAVVASCLLSFDFLHITQSRIATLDMYIACFIFLGFYYAYTYFDELNLTGDEKADRNRSYVNVVLSGIFFGMALSVKISAIGGVLGAFAYVVFMLWKEYKGPNVKMLKKLGTLSLLFVISMFIVYFISHVPLFIKDTSKLDTDDIKSWPKFAEKLKVHDNAAKEQIWSNLSQESRKALEEHKFGESMTDAHQKIIVADLNKMIGDTTFYNPDAFKDIQFWDESERLKKKGYSNLSKRDSRRFRRLIIETIYWDELKHIDGIVTLKWMTYDRTFKFHYTDKFTHPYLSQMWQWPIVHRPIWYEYDKDQNGYTRGIVAIGSLLFWWSFIPVLLDMLYRSFKEKDHRVIFIVCGYLSLYLFWLTSLSHFGGYWHFKGGFFYYMLPCVPFMALGLTETLNDLRDNKIGKVSIAIYSLGIIAFLIFFYPILVGIPISQTYYNYIMKLNIFKNWI